MEKVKEIKITLKEIEGLVVESKFEQQEFGSSFEIIGVLRHYANVLERELLESKKSIQCDSQNS
jgi:hypothetical protein